MNQPGATVPWSIKDALIVFVVAWVGAPLAAILLLAQLGHFWPLAHELIVKFSKGDVSVNFGLVAVDAMAAFGLVGYYLNKYGAKWRDLGFRKFSLAKMLMYVIVAFFALSILVVGAYWLIKLLVPGFNADQAQTNEFTNPSTPLAMQLSFLALVVIPPILEESVFRGFMFPAFSKRFGVIGGAIVSSLLFGAAHLQGNIIVYTVILGLLLCLLYRRLGSIWPGVALHMLNNYIAFSALIHK